MLELAEPPCLSLACSMLLKSQAANIQWASGMSVVAKWFHIIALGPGSLYPYTFSIPINKVGLSWIVIYCARPGYRTPWLTMELASLSATMIPVPPLYLVVLAEKEPSFQKLVPILNSINLACSRQASSGCLIS